LNWSVEREEAGQRKETALRLAGVLVRFWVVRGYVSEGRTWLEQALANSEGITPDVRANALCGAGWLAFFQSDVERAEVLCEEGLTCYREAKEKQKTPAMASSLIFLGWLALRKDDDRVVRFLLDESRAVARDMGDKRSLANLLHFLAGSAMSQDKYAEARSLLEECLALFGEMGDRATIAWALRLLGLVHFALRDKAHAYALIEESLALSREMRDTPGSAYSLFILGRFALAQGDAATARPLMEESLTPFRAFGDRQPIAHVLSRLANVAMQQGDDAAAQTWYEESLALFRQTDDKSGLALCLQGWGAMVARQGEAIWAARLWGAAETLRDVRSLRNPFLLFVEHTDYEQADYERMMSTVRTQLGENAFAAAWAEGRVMTPEQVLAKQGLETVSEIAISAPQLPHTDVLTLGYPNGLTTREVGVLRLVAGGLTNNEIAEELGLSEKTIAHHLTRIFNKTTSENRAAAAAFAIRHGLA
jgi:DNA-binding CsgD family transcriptional regulator/tetratricopeptide (TPR) repeat protein